jgi:TPP-dependent pyruvate/acetoin dehydrogenase alpha subunit
VGPSTDWHLGYRSADEGQVWSNRDPIQRMKAIIQANHDGSSDELIGEMNQKIRSYVELVYQRARSSDVLSLDELKRFVYPA